MKSFLLSSVVASTFALTLSTAAFAQDPATATMTQGATPGGATASVTEQTKVRGPADIFGQKGQIAVSSDAALSIQNSSTSGIDGSTTTIELAPAADYFVIPNLSVGGVVDFNYTTTSGGHSTRFAIGPRVGYNIPISDLISIWPKIGLSYAATSTKASADIPNANGGTTTISNSSSGSALALSLFAPVMFHPAPHFFAGFGPFLDTDLSGDAKTTVFGGKLTLGGWL